MTDLLDNCRKYGKTARARLRVKSEKYSIAAMIIAATKTGR
jgi:hypothetical protein